MVNLAFNSKEDANPESFLVQSCTDKGRIRPNNEDYQGHYIPRSKSILDKLGSLFVISDGVGGSAAGEVASAEAVNVLLQEYYFGAHSERVPERLKNAYQHTAMQSFEYLPNGRRN